MAFKVRNNEIILNSSDAVVDSLRLGNVEAGATTSPDILTHDGLGNVTLQNVNIDGTNSISDTTVIDFDTTLSNPSHLEGRLFYDNSIHALSYYNDAVDVTLNIGREVMIRVKNNTGSVITNGSVVYISGTDAPTELPEVTLSQADSIISAGVDGVVTHDIPVGDEGFMTRIGTVRDLSTSTYSAGDIVYLSATAAGGLTTTPPTWHAYVVEIGRVTKVDAAQGEIELNITSHGFLNLQVEELAHFEGGLHTESAIDMDNNLINNLATPIAGTDAATKAYVDSEIAAYDVPLGTQTSGNYVATIAGTASEIDVAGSGTETAAVTLSLPNNMVVPQNLTVTGDLTVNGTTITNDTTTLSVDDPYVTVGGSADALQADDNKDRGVRFRWHDGTADVTAGSFVVSTEYVITSTGTTDFTLIGAADSNPGTIFTATGTGTGTGTANETANTKIGFFGLDDSTGNFCYIPDATETGQTFSGTFGDAHFGTVTATFSGDGSSVTNVDAQTLDGLDSTYFYSPANPQPEVDNYVDALTIPAGVLTLGRTGALSDLTVDLDARYYTETEADTRFVNVTGDTMTGALTLPGDPTALNHAANKNYVDNQLGALSDKYVDTVSFNTLDGVLTLGRTNGLPDLTTGFDGRYSLSTHNHDTSYAALAHNHDTAYAALAHNHDTAYVNVTGDTMTGTLTISTIDGNAGVSNDTLNVTGHIVATGDVTAYSDRRFKHNIETIANAVETVEQLRGVTFEKDNKTSMGVIAQEVEEVLPEVVHTSEEGLKSVAYGNMVGLLLEAIKEQQQQINTLRKELDKLSNK